MHNSFDPPTRDGCSFYLSVNGKASPRTCEICGLGPCRFEGGESRNELHTFTQYRQMVGKPDKSGSESSEVKRLAALVQQLLAVVMIQGKAIGELQRKTGFGPEPMTPEENLAFTNLARLTQGLPALDRIEQHHVSFKPQLEGPTHDAGKPNPTDAP